MRITIILSLHLSAHFMKSIIQAVVNFVEFAYIAAEWQTETMPVMGDITGDGEVDIDDIVELGFFWLE